MTRTDQELMAQAFAEAEAAALREEVPVGAVIYHHGRDEILAAAGNRTIEFNDPTAHAEMLAIRRAAEIIGNYRLLDCSLFVTLEPCVMCAGAISFARLSRLVYGAGDPKGGAVDHGPEFFRQPTCHHRPEVSGGLMREECGAILRDFFASRR